MLHLHCLNNQQGLILCDCLAGCNKNLDDLAGHGSKHRTRSPCCIPGRVVALKGDFFGLDGLRSRYFHGRRTKEGKVVRRSIVGEGKALGMAIDLERKK